MAAALGKEKFLHSGMINSPDTEIISKINVTKSGEKKRKLFVIICFALNFHLNFFSQDSERLKIRETGARAREVTERYSA